MESYSRPRSKVVLVKLTHDVVFTEVHLDESKVAVVCIFLEQKGFQNEAWKGQYESIRFHAATVEVNQPEPDSNFKCRRQAISGPRFVHFRPDRKESNVLFITLEPVHIGKDARPPVLGMLERLESARVRPPTVDGCR